MRTAMILTLAVVLGLVAVPLSSATVMHATINTQTNVGTINATSNYVLYYTYPANSSTSQQLNGTIIWLNATSYVNATTRQQLQDDMNGYSDAQGRSYTNGSDSGASSSIGSNTTMTNNSSSNQAVVHVVNATMTYQTHAFADQTNLTVYRNLTLHMTITNITKQTGNNTTVIDMSWRAFGVQGQLESSFHGTIKVLVPALQLDINSAITTKMDVNELGDMNLGLGEDGQGYGSFGMGTFFGHDGFGGKVMAYSTINFHVFARPLSSWVKVYDSATNSTTFYYNTSSSYALNSSVNDNGSIYTVKLKIDPHGSITTNGYATPTSSNELSISSSPPSAMSSTTLLIIGVVIILGVVAIASALIRRGKPKKQA